jgi:hypothetical protein
LDKYSRSSTSLLHSHESMYSVNGMILFWMFMWRENKLFIIILILYRVEIELNCPNLRVALL